MRKGAGLPFGVILAAAAVGASCGPEPPAKDPIARGKQVYQQAACASCHAPSIWHGFRAVGPPLDRIGTVAGTRLPDTPAEAYIRASITDPGGYVVPGYPDSMPRGLADAIPEQDLGALVAYLASLR